MTTLKVVQGFKYLTKTEGIVWRQDDYTINKIVKSVKGESFSKYFRRPVDGIYRDFTSVNAHVYVNYMCRKAGIFLAKRVNGPFAIVPVPNSDADLASTVEFRTLHVARLIAKHSPADVETDEFLRWKHKLPKTHSEGGSRDPDVLLSNLHLKYRPDRPVVIFDDVMTSGAHLEAAYRKLEAAGCRVVLAFVFARATKVQEPTPLKAEEREILF
jgi:adenine/guanine phosphoribosyltransferase-like PRPP-binding protein